METYIILLRKVRGTVNEKKLIHEVAVKHRDRVFNNGIDDLTTTSIDFSTGVMGELASYGIKSIGLTGWLKIPNYENRVFIMYVKIQLNNKKILYLDIFNGEDIIYEDKMKSLKKNRYPKNKKDRHKS